MSTHQAQEATSPAAPLEIDQEEEMTPEEVKAAIDNRRTDLHRQLVGAELDVAVARAATNPEEAKEPEERLEEIGRKLSALDAEEQRLLGPPPALNTNPVAPTEPAPLPPAA